MHFHVTVSVSPGYVLVYAAFIFMWILLCDFYFRIDLFMWNYRSYKYHFSYAHIGTFSLIPIISNKKTPINPPIIRLPIGITSRKRCSPKGNKPTLRQACFMVCCSFRPLEVRRHLVNALPKGAVNLVPLRTSTSGSVSEVQYTIKPLLYIFQCIRLRNLRNLHKLKHSNNRIAYNSKNNHLNKTASSNHVWNISCHRSVQI